MNERRREGRFLCADLITVEWRARGTFQTVEAVLEDISPLGTCVQVEDEIPHGTPVTITLGGQKLSGEVSYCVYRDYGYFVGIRFPEESQWSSGVFIPQHLTDLRALASGPIDLAGT